MTKMIFLPFKSQIGLEIHLFTKLKYIRYIDKIKIMACHFCWIIVKYPNLNLVYWALLRFSLGNSVGIFSFG